MIKYAIWGAGKSGLKLKNIIKREYKDKKIAYFVESDATKWGEVFWEIPIISPESFKKKLEENSIEGVIIPGCYSDRVMYDILYLLLKKFNIDKYNIMIAPSWVIDYGKNKEDFDKLFTACLATRELWMLSYIVTCKCNLSCIPCTECSPLYHEEENETDNLNNFTADMERLKLYFDNIKLLGISGGEPMLLKNLDEYFNVARLFFPYADISFRTNATLIKQMNQNLIESVRKNKITVIISLYDILENKIDSIVNFLNKKSLNFRIDRCISFTKRISLTEKHDLHAKSEACLKDMLFSCVQMKNGSLCRCPFPISLPIFNKAFNQNLPDEGLFNIYSDKVSTEIIWSELLRPIEFCKYCRMQEHICDTDWKSEKKEPIIDEWAWE